MKTMGKRMSDLERISALITVLESKGIINQEDKDFINGDITEAAWMEGPDPNEQRTKFNMAREQAINILESIKNKDKSLVFSERYAIDYAIDAINFMQNWCDKVAETMIKYGFDDVDEFQKWCEKVVGDQNDK